jgi:hypothetical protein
MGRAATMRIDRVPQDEIGPIRDLPAAQRVRDGAPVLRGGFS